MKNKSKNTTLPELRFPEFSNSTEWNKERGGELFDQISNKDHDSNLPILAITQEHGAVPREEINYHVSVSEKSVESYKVVQVDDFIISLRSFQGGIEHSNYEGLCSPAYVILRNKTPNLNCYFKHLFKSERFIRDMTKNIEGLRDGKMVSYKQFSELVLCFPPTEAEQQKIADCLTSIDELIKSEEQKLQNLQARKKVLMTKLFPIAGARLPNLRFPQFENEGNWDSLPLGEVFDRLTTKNKEDNKNVLTISAQDGLVSQLEYFNKKIAARDVTSYYLLEKGDFAYNKSYSKGYPMGAIKPLKRYEKGVVSTLYICFRLKKEFCGLFWEYYFDSGAINCELEQVAQEGARNHGLLNIGISDFFENVNLYFPSLKEQQYISSFFATVDSLIDAHAAKLEFYKRHHTGLMQQLYPSFDEVME